MFDRQTWKLPFRVIEVMNVNQINLHSSRAGIGSLLDPAGHGNTVSDRLAGCVELFQGEPAEAAPTGWLSSSFHAKIMLCRANTRRLAS
jgi:hypothetical protein